MRIKILKRARDLGGRIYEKGTEVEARFASDGVPQVIGAGYLPLNPEEWEPAWEEDPRSSS